MEVVQRIRITVVKSKKAQAVVETIFLLPILMAFVLLIFQAYYLIHKVQISQKNLKQVVLGVTGNRYDLSAAKFRTKSAGVLQTGQNSKFFYVVNEIAENGQAMMAFRLAIPEMLKWVIPTDKRADFKELENTGLGARQSMGFCNGAYKDKAYGIKLSPRIFDVDNTAWTCNND